MHGIDTDLLCHLSEVTKFLLVIRGIRNFLLGATGCHDF